MPDRAALFAYDFRRGLRRRALWTFLASGINSIACVGARPWATAWAMSCETGFRSGCILGRRVSRRLTPQPTAG